MNKQLLRDFVTTRLDLQELLKETLHGKEQVPATAKANQLAKTKNAMKKMSQLKGKKTSQ